MAGTPGYEMTVTIAGKTVGKSQGVDWNMNVSEVEVTTQDSGGSKEFIPGLFEFDVSIESLWVPDNDAFIAIEAALLAKTEVACTFFGPSGKTYAGQAIVTSENVSRALDGAVSSPWTLKGTGSVTPTGS